MHAGIVVLIAALGAPGPRFVQGIVRTPDGAPVEQATVVVYESGPADWRPTPTITAANGRFVVELPNDPARTRRSSATCTVVAYRAGKGLGAVEFNRDNLPLRSIPIVLEPCPPLELSILDPQGQAVPDAEVRLGSFSVPRDEKRTITVPLGNADFSLRRTDASGRARFDCVPANSSSCSVEITTAAFGTLAILDYPLPRQSPGPIRLRPVGRITGRVVVDEPALAVGSKLWLMSILPRDPDKSAYGIARVAIDAEGRFEVPALAIGVATPTSYEAGERSPYFLPEAEAGNQQSRRVTLEAGATANLDIPLVKGIRVRGSVVEEGAGSPVAGALLEISPYSRTAGAFVVATAADGQFEAWARPGRARASARLIRVPAPWALGAFDRNRDSPSPPADRVEFAAFKVPRGIELTGTVVDEQGRPVPYAHVHGDAQLNSSMRGQADGAGRFLIGPFPEGGKVLLSAEDDDRASVQTLAIDLSDPNVRNPLRLAIEPGGLISVAGRLVDDDGAPIDGADIEVRVSRMEPAEPPGTNRGSTEYQFTGRPRLTTDAEGRFALPHTVARVAGYRILSKPADRIAVDVEVPVPAPSSATVNMPEIVMHGLRRIAGKVVDRQQRPVAGVTVSSFGPRWAGSPISAVTDAEGKYTLDGLHSRSRLVFANKDGFRFAGTSIPRRGEPGEITLARLNEAPEPGQARKTRLFPPERRRELFDDLARDADRLEPYYRSWLLQGGATVDPEIARRALQEGSPFWQVRVHLALGAFDEALAAAALVPDASARGNLLLAIADADPDAARRRRTLISIAPLPGQIAQPFLRFRLLSQMMRKLNSAGDQAAALKLLEEWLPQLDAITDARALDQARGALAAGGAEFAPDQAMKLVVGRSANALQEHRGQIAYGLAASAPEQAERFLAQIPEEYTRHEATVPVCYRLATRDLPRADRLAAGIRRDATRILAQGSIAYGLFPQDPEQSRKRLRATFAEMDKLRRGRAAEPALFQSAMVFVRLAETIEPDAVEEYVWHAAAQHPGPPSVDAAWGGTWPEHREWYSGMLVTLLALYDVAPQAAREVAQPLLQQMARFDGPINIDNGPTGLHPTFLYTGLALTYPEKTIAWHREFLAAVAGDQRFRPGTATGALMQAFFDEPAAFWEYLHLHYGVWTIGSDDVPQR